MKTLEVMVLCTFFCLLVGCGSEVQETSAPKVSVEDVTRPPLSSVAPPPLYVKDPFGSCFVYISDQKPKEIACSDIPPNTAVHQSPRLRHQKSD